MMTSAPPPAFAVTLELPILWSDEDSFAHVNNVAYLRWCEEGRIAYLRRIGLFPPVPPRGIGPILASVTCHYRAQLTYPDTIIVGTRVVRIGNSSIQMEQRILSGDGSKIAADAEATMVTIDYATGKAVRVPDEVREAIAGLEGLVG
jgi:acyl-CoA thioester hydrolase